jgi:hypothetical protein
LDAAMQAQIKAANGNKAFRIGCFSKGFNELCGMLAVAAYVLVKISVDFTS